ncbi:MAG: NAD-dependent malic enzyme [Planctomycetota bacterium]|jgi:malate dehydrogenase (oxaloacetate-decarboxylating)
MNRFVPQRDPETGKLFLPVRERGRDVVRNPLLNKGTAFPEAERDSLAIRGLLPARVTTLEVQQERAYEAFRTQSTDLDKYGFLARLQESNETLFFRLVLGNLEEMTPIIYTPVVAKACSTWSRGFRRTRGLFITPGDRGRMEQILGHARGEPDVIVVTDNERILGIGDQGVGGMGIPVGKLALYSLAGGIHPASCLPVSLDFGTDNGDLLRDPLYVGWRQPRIRGDEYWSLVDEFVDSVRKVYPHALLQWEDFAKGTSFRNLDTHRDRICSFNDDIQGTAAVSVAGLMGAMRLSGGRLRDQTIVLLGAGSAGVGISSLIADAMVEEGATREEAKRQIYTLDSKGLVVQGRTGLDEYKQKFAVEPERIASWGVVADNIPLLEVVRRARPTVLFGVSGQAGAFTEEVVRAMVRRDSERPVILPLSNPTSHAEATPADIIAWTGGRAIVGTGSPFADVIYDGRRHRIGQGNNVFIFPGVGLGAIACKASRVTDGMFLAAASALAGCVTDELLELSSVYPSIDDVRVAARTVALAVAKRAEEEGVARDPDDCEKRIDQTMWSPEYVEYRAI